MRIRDVSSDVWSSDLADGRARRTGARDGPAHLPARPCGAGRRRRPYRAELCGNDPEGKPDVTSVLAAYDALVAAGELKADLEQRTAAARLSPLQEALEAAPPRGSLLWRIAGRKLASPRGVYLCGAARRGKHLLKTGRASGRGRE